MLADQVAQTALHHYQTNLPGKGKPREDSEWTVYAAIVAVPRDDAMGDNCGSSSSTSNGIHNFGDGSWVVSCATGTKCCALHQQSNKTVSSCSGLSILHDSHAEVLARRGLQRVLWEEIIASTQNIPKNAINNTQQIPQLSRRLLVEATPLRKTSGSGDQDLGQETVFFQLNTNIDLHMYISDSPCGDASIYTLKPAFLTDPKSSTDTGHPASKDKRSQQQFTGAKVIASNQTNLTVQDCGGPVLETPAFSGVTTSSSVLDQHTNPATVVQLVREAEQQLTGKLRTKSGRSNLHPNHRSWSMSCSDKLVRYSVLGWEGTLLAARLVQPIRLTSIVVGSDPRALSSKEQDSTTDTAASVTQIGALQRAIPNRVQAVRATLLEQSEDKMHKSSCCSRDDTKLFAFAQEMPIPTVCVSQYTFPRGKSSVLLLEPATATQGTAAAVAVAFGNKRKRSDDQNSDATNKNSKTPSPCGISLNWHQQQLLTPDFRHHDGVELVVGARGIRHGKKPQSAADFVKLQSRLCRNSLWQLAVQALSPPLGGATTTVAVVETNKEPSRCNDDVGTNNECVSRTTGTAKEYGARKRQHGCALYLEVKKIILTQGPLAGWLIGDSAASGCLDQN